MDYAQLRASAEFLNDAERDKKEVTRLTMQYPAMTLAEGYAIQDELVKIKKESGNKLIGMKMGLTSEAKMKQMKIENPIYGHLFDYMYVKDGGEIPIKDLIHPKVESEIAFIMKDDLEGENLTIEQVMDAVDYVVPVMEIIDSRYENFQFQLPDVVADNSSSSRIIVGDKLTRPEGLALDLLGATLSINGKIVEQGVGAAVLGHPAKAVAMLASMLSGQGKKIEAGHIVMTGALTAAVMLQAGDVVSTTIEEIGTVGFVMTE